MTFAWPSRSRAVRALAPALLLAGSACDAPTISGPLADTSLEGLALTSLAPDTVLPGTLLVAQGRSFVAPPWGEPQLRLRGTLDGRELDLALPLTFADYDRLELSVDGAFTDRIGAVAGEFTGEAVVEIESRVDGQVHASAPLPVALSIREQLDPQLDTVQSGGVIFVNDGIAVAGDGLLLGAGEGTTMAEVSGCFRPLGAAGCEPVAGVSVPVQPVAPFDRERGRFAFHPSIAGIRPGGFVGEVRLRNELAGGAAPTSRAMPVSYEIVPPAIYEINPEAVSLGQFAIASGGGFVGQRDGGATLLNLQGEFRLDGEVDGKPVDMTLVGEVADGNTLRYVVNEGDSLGQALNLYTQTGTFSGTARPVVSFATDEVVGYPISVTLRVAPVRQVVRLVFLASYVESLRHFGLRAVDREVRARAVEVAAAAYETVNVDIRTEPPADFALFSTVEVGGPDPNGLGLLGYDNTPGKDRGNRRLYDRIGGVNALTQEQDGYAGYGGVFIESMFGFSEDPGSHAERMEGADPAFDELFDPFRPDRGGTPVVAADLVDPLPMVDPSADCPAAAGDRSMQIGCAVSALGALIGGTIAHEVGHSLGLANPYGEGFHNSGDQANRLMDSGASRSFSERTELFGDGPARFCQDEYDYLRDILPTDEPANRVSRPPC